MTECIKFVLGPIHPRLTRLKASNSRRIHKYRLVFCPCFNKFHQIIWFLMKYGFSN
jgi:hypothetical protein